MPRIFIGNIKGPKGDTGATGATGATGPKGDTGDRGATGVGLDIKGLYASQSALEAAVPSPSAGDAYMVGAAAPYDLYIYSGSAWTNCGEMPGLPVDDTLTASGQAADAKVTGDSLDTLSGIVKNPINTTGFTWESGQYNTGSGWPSDTNNAIRLVNIPYAIKGSKIFLQPVESGYSLQAIEMSSDTGGSQYVIQVLSGTSIVTEHDAYLRIELRKNGIAGDTTKAEYVQFDLLTTDKIKVLENSVSVLQDDVSTLSISVSSIKANMNVRLYTDGHIASTSSAVGTSEKLYCKTGAKIHAKLSTMTGYLVFAVYGADGSLRFPLSETDVQSVIGAGSNAIKDFTYTFGADDAYFRLSGYATATTIPRFSVDYSYKLPVIEGIEQRFDGLPDYWVEYLGNKLPAITAKDALIGNHGDSFIFISDVHVPNSSMYSPAICRYIYKNSSVQKMVNGGDYLNVRTGTTGKADALADLQKWQSAAHGLNELEVVGNHDFNNYNGTNASNELTLSEYYGVVTKHVESVCDTDAKSYYAFENKSQKVCYIIVDCESTSSVFQQSLSFMQNKLLSLPAGWTAVIIQHRYWKWANGELAVDAVGTSLCTAINNVYANLNCAVAGVFVGHTHIDTDTTDATNHYPIIGINCDKCGDADISGVERTAGTTSEHCLDVVHIDTLARKIYATRIGAGDTIVGDGSGVREYSY